jgi:hypothetical protein
MADRLNNVLKLIDEIPYANEKALLDTRTQIRTEQAFIIGDRAIGGPARPDLEAKLKQGLADIRNRLEPKS